MCDQEKKMVQIQGGVSSASVAGLKEESDLLV